MAEGKVNSTLGCGGNSNKFADFTFAIKNLNGTEAKVEELDAAGEAEDSGGVRAALAGYVVGESIGTLSEREARVGEVFVDVGQGGDGDKDTVEDSLASFVGGQGRVRR